MSYSTESFTTRDNLNIYYYHWASIQEKPKGVVLIAHGLGEHAGRYIHIATLLQQNGFEVYANDHRIHGKSVSSEANLGIYEGANYFDDAIEDMKELSIMIRKEHAGEKLILFGHSMGSFFSRAYVLVHLCTLMTYDYLS